MAITMNKCHVTMVLALNLILGLFGNFFTLWLVSSAVRSFTKIYKRNFHISWNFYEMTLANDPYTLYNRQVDLRNFEKRENK